MRAWWLRLARQARPPGRGMLGVVLLMLVGVGFEVLKPWPLKLIVDSVLAREPLPAAARWLAGLPGAGSPSGLIAWLAGATVLLFLAIQGAGVAQRTLQAGVGSRMVHALGGALFGHLQRLSLRFHGRQRTGDLVRRVVTDAGCIRDLWSGVLLPLVTSLASLVAMFAIMWRLDRTLALLALGAAPLLGLVIRLASRPMAERAYAQEEAEGARMALAEQTLGALPVVQAFGREERERERFRGLSLRTLRAHLRLLSSQLVFDVGVGSVTAAGTAALMVFGGFRVLSGELSVGGLLVFLSYLASLYGPMQQLAYLSSGLATARAGARRVLEVLEADEGVRDAPDARPLPGCGSVARGHVVLEGVRFGYEAGRPVLEGVDLELGRGETVAVVGPTGAGKSTLAALIPRFYDPSEGRVLVEGADVRRVTLASLRARIAIVQQEPLLLPLSIEENIAYGRPEAAGSEVVAAAEAAGADAFIRRLPRGYETQIGERGATLSGGERQRLAIARALLRDAPILILDEPTAALDLETEARLLEALERLSRGRTSLVIAHRLSTVRRADRIIVIENGRIVEQGPHAELLRAGGSYARLHALQSGEEAPRGV